MEYVFNNYRNSKSFSEMIQLKNNIKKGLKCTVATLNPERTKKDFEYMTGEKLELNLREGNKNIYNASLSKS